MSRRLSTLVRPLLLAIVFAAASWLALVGDALLLGRRLEPRLLEAFGLFAAGAFLAALITWPLSALAFSHRPPTARFAGVMILLMVGSAGAAALMFFLQYRLYYSAWHGTIFSADWLFHFIFTGAAAAYLFAVTGLPLFLPLGLPLLLAAALAITHWTGQDSSPELR